MNELVKESVRTVLRLVFATQAGKTMNLVIHKPKSGLTKDVVDIVGNMIANNQGLISIDQTPVVAYRGANYMSTAVRPVLANEESGPKE